MGLKIRETKTELVARIQARDATIAVLQRKVALFEADQLQRRRAEAVHALQAIAADESLDFWRRSAEDLTRANVT